MDEYAALLFEVHSEIKEIVVFGSFVDNTYAPGSDLDVFIRLSSATHSVRDRIPRLLPEHFPVPLDLFPLTEQEISGRAGSPVLEAVARSDWRYVRPAGRTASGTEV